MLISKNTSNGKTKSLLIKVAFILAIFIGIISLLDKIDFPSPDKKIKKFIPNENLKIVK